MPYFEYIIGAALVILTCVLTAVGIQLFLLLRELRNAVTRVNVIVDEAGERISGLVHPLRQIGSAMVSVKAGMKVFDAFASWLNKGSDKK